MNLFAEATNRALRQVRARAFTRRRTARRPPLRTEATRRQRSDACQCGRIPESAHCRFVVQTVFIHIPSGWSHRMTPADLQERIAHGKRFGIVTGLLLVRALK